jgi:hypothetical protein
MSKIALTPNASGSGTFTIAAPNSNTDRSLTLPDEAGTVLTTATSAASIPTNNGKHRFFAKRTATNQSVSNNTHTVAVFDNEQFDVSSAYNTSTGEYTVPETGLYFFIASIKHSASGNTNLWNGGTQIQQNTSTIYSNFFNYAANYINEAAHPVSGIIYCSTNDVIRVRAIVETNSGSGSIFAAGDDLYFAGFMVS